MKKIELHFPLHNPFFYWGSIAVMVAIAVICNNHFFYQTKDKNVKLQLEDTLNILGSFYETCLEAKSSTECQTDLKNSLEKTFDFGFITILDHEKREILNLNKESYRDNRDPVRVELSAGKKENEIHFFLTKLSSPYIYDSVINSLTFSAGDIYKNFRDGKEVIPFIRDIAIPRSNSVFYSLAIIWFIMQFARKTDDARKRHNEALKRRIDSVTKARQDAIEKVFEAEIRVEEFKKKAEHEGEMTREFEIELEKMVKEVEEHRESVTKLIQLQNEAAKNQEPELDSEDKALEKLLFKILKVHQASEKFDYNPGMHHGKDYVIRVCESLLKDDVGSRLIKRANSTANGPRKRGKLILECNEYKEYILSAYSADHDSGFGVELALHAKNVTEATLIARYLSTVSKGKLRSSALKFEVHTSAKAS